MARPTTRWSRWPRAIEAAGASIINTGIGWHEARIPTIATSVPRRAFVWVTQKLMGRVGVPLITSNRINSPDVVEAVLAEGCADMVSMARPFLADADFIAKAAAGRAAQIAPCIACNQACLDHTFAGKISTCLVNPRACFETELVVGQAAKARRVAVVGAGPAGLAAALAAAERGHAVTLFEKAGEIGGQLNLAKVIPGKEEFHGLVAWSGVMLRQTQVTLKLNTSAAVEDLEEFDDVILTTGVRPREVDNPNQSGGRVLSYVDVLRHNADVGARVVIVGAGGIGFDVAEKLAHTGASATEDTALWMREWGVADPEDHRSGLAPEGAQPAPAARAITMLQRKATRPGKGLGKTTGWIHRAALKAKAVEMIAGVNYERITGEGLEVSFGPGRERPTVIAADTVVICAGQVPERNLAQALDAIGRTFVLIGGADVATELDAKRAIDQGTRVAAAI